MLEKVAGTYDFASCWNIDVPAATIIWRMDVCFRTTGRRDLRASRRSTLAPSAVPDHVSLWGSLIQFRREFDQHVNLRPVNLIPRVGLPARKPETLRHRLLRRAQKHRGEYSSIDACFPGTDREFVVQETVMTRIGVDRVLRFVFELAVQRNRHLTSATREQWRLPCLLGERVEAMAPSGEVGPRDICRFLMER